MFYSARLRWSKYLIKSFQDKTFNAISQFSFQGHLFTELAILKEAIELTEWSGFKASLFSAIWNLACLRAKSDLQLFLKLKKVFFIFFIYKTNIFIKLLKQTNRLLVILAAITKKAQIYFSSWLSASIPAPVLIFILIAFQFFSNVTLPDLIHF